MWRNFTRLTSAVLLGLTLVFGIIADGSRLQQPQFEQLDGPGHGGTGGGG